MHHRLLSATVIVFAHLSVLGVPACSKENKVNPGGTQNPICDDGKACEGACVEGLCRSHCTTNYTCTGDATCVSIEGTAVCMPKDARTYEPYAPLDLLTGCSQRGGCEVKLDAPALQGYFRACDAPNFTAQDFLNSSFDYASACPNVTDYEPDHLYIKGRSVFRVSNGECGDVRVIGQAGESTLVETCSEYGGPTSVLFTKLVRVGSDVYMWRDGPRPHTGPGSDNWYGGDWTFWLWKMANDKSPASTPTCEADTEECSLPAYPRVGVAASQFAGLWVPCGGQTPETCESGWDQSEPNSYRTMYYIREDGFGEVMQKGGTARNPMPATCSAAFRMGSEGQVLIFGHHDFPIGELQMQEVTWTRYSVPSGEFLASGRFEGGQFMGGQFFKKVPPPEGFVDPCSRGLPTFKF